MQDATHESLIEPITHKTPIKLVKCFNPIWRRKGTTKQTPISFKASKRTKSPKQQKKTYVKKKCVNKKKNKVVISTTTTITGTTTIPSDDTAHDTGDDVSNNPFGSPFKI